MLMPTEMGIVMIVVPPKFIYRAQLLYKLRYKVYIYIYKFWPVNFSLYIYYI